MSNKKSYAQILRSSSLIGGSEIVKLAVGVIQVKFVAIFLGPIGVGLSGTYDSLITFVQSFVGLGISTSGVREIAHAFGTSDREGIGRSVLTLRRICWLTGTGGALLVVLFARPLSRMTFGSTEHAWALILLAWIILMRNIKSAQMCYIQGSRRIKDLASLKIVGAVGGAIIGIGFYAWLRLDGIVPALLMLAVFELAASWWFARRVPPPRVVMAWKESVRMSWGFLHLGLAFMWTGLLANAVAYVSRLLINREVGLHAVGIFQSSYRISILFVSFILQAMSADYFPRLAAASSDHGKMKQLLNEQTEIGLLLAAPGLLATLVLAPVVIRVFYTTEFAQAAELLRWFVLGCLGQVISWPMGYVIGAKGKTGWMFLTETAASCIHLLLIWIGLNTLGVEGVAIAFFVLYVIYSLMIFVIVKRLIGFAWNTETRRVLLSIVAIVAGVFLVSELFSEVYSVIIGSLATLIASVCCTRELIKRLGKEHRVTRIIGRLPLLGAAISHGIYPS